MMVRTYGRRKPGMPRTLSDSLSDAVSQGDCPSSSSSPDSEPHGLFSLPFSSQDSSSLWHSSSRSAFQDASGNGAVRKAKRPRNGQSGSSDVCSLTSTLMEAQEFGEMMEHVDEVNFALDGLKNGQQLRIRRASLSSLLSICASQQQRRFLRAQGIAKSIIDVVLGLSLDDIPSNLAAATLFSLLTADGQDEHFMESPSCIKFLIKLLKPVVATGTEGRPRNIGFKLLSLLKDAEATRDTTKVHEPSHGDIVSRVHEILVNCKEMKLIDSHSSGTMKPEICTKLVALLAIEKACLSKVSFDDTTGAVRKTGGNFKEKLRELGGLDAVVEVVMDCHSCMKCWVEQDPLSIPDQKDNQNKQSLMLLLRCLKIMENAMFLSRENQNHLLGFKRTVDSHRSQSSFTELMISVIKFLSGLHLRRGLPTAQRNKRHSHYSNCVSHDSVLASVADSEVNKEILTISSNTCPSLGCNSMSTGNISHGSRSSVQLDCSVAPVSGAETNTTLINEPCTSGTKVGSSISGSLSNRLKSFSRGINRRTNVRSTSGLGGEPTCMKSNKLSSLEDSQDPFAFDLEDPEPSKWEVLSGKKKKSRAQKRKECYRETKGENPRQFSSSQEESSHRLNSQGESSDRNQHVSCQASCSIDVDEECLSLLSDCLLTAVKVLMNLTNDNAIGSRQIAACGGLETMSELIVGHFPLFSTTPSVLDEIDETASCHQKDRHLADQELDFLVAILGLLVNLVEKDGTNRSRLATTSVSVPNSEGLQDRERDMIPLLCSIFLANQGSSDATDEASPFTLDDEEAVLESEKEAEKMIVEAYSALLLAFLSTESTSTRNAIKDHLPNGNLASLVPVLERFVAFHLTLNMIPPETHKAVKEVIESCKLP